MANSNKTRTFLLLIQIILTLLYGAAIVHMTIVLYRQNNFSVFYTGVLGYLSQMVILIASLFPQIFLRLRRKLYSQEGEIYPILFTMICLGSSLIIPQYSAITGLYPFDISFVQTLELFSLLGTAMMFLISALRFYGLSSSRLNQYTVLMIGSSLVLCILTPIDTNIVDNSGILSSRFNSYILIAAALFYIATIATMIINCIKDKTASNIKKCIAFILLITGIILAIPTQLIPTIISSIFYIIGIVLIISSTSESF